MTRRNHTDGHASSTPARRSTPSREGELDPSTDEAKVAIKAGRKAKARGGSKRRASALTPPQYSGDVARVIDGVEAAQQSLSPTKLAEAAEVQELRLDLPAARTELPLEQRGDEVTRLAHEAFAKTTSWVVFYREMLGVEGVVATLYPTKEERQFFETQPEFLELLEIVTSLRSQDTSKMDAYEPTRMLTVRMPRSLHAEVIRRSEEQGLSLNSYAITKLLQPVDKRFTPEETGGRRGRKPGPQMVLVRTRGKKLKLQRE